MKHLLYIGNKLSDHGYTSTSIETLGMFLENVGFHVYYASSKRNKIVRMFEMIFKTLKYARKVDYVLIDTYSTKNFWYAFFISQLCRLLRLKYIPKLHGGNLPNRINRSKFFSDFIFKNAHVNVAPSNYLYEAFYKKGYTNLIYIPNTIEVNLYTQSLKEYDAPRLLWVRSFAEIYNPIMAIKVFIRVKQLFPNARICMVGPIKDKSYSKTLRFVKNNNIEVLFTGKLSKEEWIELSKEYNIFINTTHFDNTPISVIEAMALGLPIISTNVGGIPYLLDHNTNALLINDNDAEDMTNQIIRLMKEPKLAKKLAENGKELIKDFDWDIVKNQWIELLI
jgi:glycosyltransferase involved in cell wall biosynthesis